MKIISQKPDLFQQSDSSIWTDSYIQHQMLAAHLNPDGDAASRKPESIRRTVEFINQSLKPQSRILDLGCGPGLYAEQLTAAGHIVTGVDFNAASIEYARKQNPEISYLEADYIKNFPAGEYDAIVMIYCDMGTHSDAARDTLLANCVRSLPPGGKLIFDVFDSNLADEFRESSTWEHAPNGGFWSAEEYLLLKQTFHYPEAHVFAYQYNLITNGKTKHFIIWEHYYSPEEITAILHQAGFRDVTIRTGLLTGNNFTSSREMFITTEK